MKNIKTTLHYYRFEIRDAEDKRKYELLRNRLISEGRKVFDSEFYRDLAQLDNCEIELETKHVFDNQWNTAPTKTSKTGLRVFDWSEAIYPNKHLKEGMYLDITPEMVSIRENKCACGYCGKQYMNPKIEFCESCLDSEYLTEDNLPFIEVNED